MVNLSTLYNVRKRNFEKKKSGICKSCDEKIIEGKAFCEDHYKKYNEYFKARKVVKLWKVQKISVK